MIRELYQEMIVDHSQRPRNRRPMEEATHQADGHNPLCGDQVHIYLRVEGDLIQDVSFEGVGCAISTASASLMTETLKGKTLPEAEVIFKQFHEMVTLDGAPGFDGELEKLDVLSGVREFPARVKCASLAWHTLQAAIHQTPEVSTE